MLKAGNNGLRKEKLTLEEGQDVTEKQMRARIKQVQESPRLHKNRFDANYQHLGIKVVSNETIWVRLLTLI